MSDASPSDSLTSISNAVNQLGGLKNTVSAIANYLGTVGDPALVTKTAGIEQSIVDAANKAINGMIQDLGKAKKEVGPLTDALDNMIAVLTDFQNWAQNNQSNMESINTEIGKYKSNPATFNPASLLDAVKAIDQECETLLTNIGTDIKANVDTSKATLRGLVSSFNTNLNSLSAAGGNTGTLPDLSTLTQTEATNKLRTRIDNDNKEISKLTLQENLEISAAVIGGVVGVTVFVLNWWNPIGWVAAGLTAGGEAGLGAKITSDVARITQDKLDRDLSRAEQDIVGAYYSIKNVTDLLDQLTDAYSTLDQGVAQIKEWVKIAERDAERYKNQSGTSTQLEREAEQLMKAFEKIGTYCDAMATPLNSEVVSIDDLLKAQKGGKP